MAYRYGNNYRLAIGAETSLGSGFTNGSAIRFDDLTILPDKLECVPDIGQIATNAKTQNGLAITSEFRPGYQNYPVTMSGVLSHEHEILLKALTPDTTSPYCVDAIPTLKSYVILRIWSDVVSANNYIVDIATGCQLDGAGALKFSGASGGMIEYEANFKGMTWTREHAQAITGTDGGVANTTGFNFGAGGATWELCFGDTEHLKSFSLSMGYESADDATCFQNSNTRLETIPMKFSGELNYVTNYVVGNTTFDNIAETLLHGATAIEEALYFANTVKTWTIATSGQLSGYTLADPDKALFDNNVTERLCYYSTPKYPVTITVTVL
jgi:hypothetical protein